MYPPTELLLAVLYYTVIIAIHSQPLITFGWFTHVSLNTFRKFKEKIINPWVKFRYLIIGISALTFFLDSINSIILFIRQSFYDVFSIYFAVIAVSVFSIGNLVAWIFPKVIQKCLNKNYGIVEEELSEKDLMDKIKKELSRQVKNGNN
jgi:hypothetical protein